MQQLGTSKQIVGLLRFTYLNDGTAIILEFCENRELLKFLRTNLATYKETVGKFDEGLQNRPYMNTDLTLVDLMRLSWQISDGMTFLHRRNYVHRGLCAAKILVTSKLVVKISGFGLGRYSDMELHAKNLRAQKPMKWIAPESLANACFTMESDVWSYGVLLYEIFSAGRVPYERVKPDELLQFLQGGRRLEQPPLAPVDIYRTMLECWDADPDERPTGEELRRILSKCLRFLPESSEHTDTNSDTSAHYTHIY